MKNSIRVERARKNITQAQLAALVDVSRQTINAIELGKYNPSTILALKIAREFNTTVDAMFALEDGD
jgi:putative transcriptional regulator